MSESSEMTCEELAGAAAELALGVLTGRERAIALVHLDACDGCREDVRQLMATGEQLLELLPPVEPTAGFETRVLNRLGLHGPSREAAQLLQPGKPRPAAGRGTGPMRRKPGRQKPGWTRRTLAAAAVGVGVIAAGLGGWRIGVSQSAATEVPLSAASLLTAARQSIGEVYLYGGAHPWVYMSVSQVPSNGSVTCQLVAADGQVTNLGSFQLADGYGSWASPDPGSVADVQGARLVAANGTVLATGTFSH